MASTNPFTVSGTLQYPPDEGQQQVSLPFGLSNSYTSLLDVKLNLTGTGTKTVPFGSVDAAKLLLVEYEAAQGQQPVLLTFNAGSDELEISSGGLLLLVSPTPQAGVSALTLAHTSAATVRVRILG